LVAPCASNPQLFLSFSCEALVAAVKSEDKVADLVNLGGVHTVTTSSKGTARSRKTVCFPGLTLPKVLHAVEHVLEPECDVSPDFLVEGVKVRDIGWQVQRGRCWRPCWTHANRETPEKPIVLLPKVDAVLARLTEGELRFHVEPLLPPEHVGLARGSSLQRTMVEVADFVRANPELTVLRLDVAHCYESISPSTALEALADLKTPRDEMRALRAFYRVNAGRFKGIGRGVAFAPLVAAATLLTVFRAIRPHVAHVVWTGDDFLCFSSDTAALERARNAANDELARLGLSASTSKFYLGPVAGAWGFGGFEFDQLRAHPTQVAVSRLVSRVEAAMSVGDIAKAARIVQGWAAQYLAAAGSPLIETASARIRALTGLAVPTLTDTIRFLVARAAGRYAPGQVGRGNNLFSLSKSNSPLRTSLMVSQLATISAAMGTSPLQSCPAAPVRSRPGTKPFSGAATALALPSRFLRQLMRVRSQNGWAQALRDPLVFHVTRGDISGHEAARVVRQSVWRARLAAIALRQGRRKGIRAWWWAMMGDGQVLEYTGTVCSTTAFDPAVHLKRGVLPAP
jgi:hypothetical protein